MSACKFCEERLPDSMEYCGPSCKEKDESWDAVITEKKQAEQKKSSSIWLENHKQKEAGN